jgi:DnaK suppressor protein
MNATKTKEVRAQLLERRDVVQTELNELQQQLEDYGVEQEIERGSLGNHLAEDGTNVQEQERILAVSADLGVLLTLVDGALQRIDEGTYGICQRCGKPINSERLEAFPYVAYCIECQTLVERQRPH